MKIAKIRDVKTPTRGTQGSAGIDFYVPNDYPNSLRRVAPGERFFIPSGVKANVPEGYALIAMNKSGVALKKGLMVGACVVDSDYQGELMISCWNRSVNEYIINPLDRIAQLVFIRVEHPRFEIVDAFDQTDRGDKGFGSSGTK